MRDIKSAYKYICLLACGWLVFYVFSWIQLSDAPQMPNQVKYTSLHSESKTCTHSSPAKNIYFLKVHKSASTTIATLLTRYAAYHRFTLALPSAGLKDKYHIGWPAPLTPNHVFNYKDGRQINMMTLHTIYNRSAVNEIMPPDTLKIAIVRDPLAQFWSAFDFFHLGNTSNHGNDSISLLTYLKNPERYERPLPRFYGKRYLKNFILTEFGYPNRDVIDVETVKQFAREISDEFDLVMVQEHIYESAILLRRLLCWKFQDILITHFHKNNLKQHLAGNETLRELHKKWSRGDYVFYDYFRLKFDALIKAQDASFVKEVAHFRNVVEKIEVFCHREDRQKLGIKKYIVPKSKWNPKLLIRPVDCREYFHLHVYDYHTIQIEKYMEKNINKI